MTVTRLPTLKLPPTETSGGKSPARSRNAINAISARSPKKQSKVLNYSLLETDRQLQGKQASGRRDVLLMIPFNVVLTVYRIIFTTRPGHYTVPRHASTQFF